MKVILSIVALAAIAAFVTLKFNQPTRISDDADLFAQWQQEQGRLYGSLEEQNYRLQVFKNNLERVNRHNALNKSYTMALNQFADLTEEEFRAKYLTLKGEMAYNNVVYLESNGDVPSTVDWRDQGIVGAVKDQGQCGSCWAFSAVAALEGLYAQKTQGEQAILSEQELVDCSRSQGNEGCNGGLMDYAFEYVHFSGIESGKDYPYKARDQKCKSTPAKKKFQIDGYADVPPNDNDQLEIAAAKGVVSVAIEADTEVFQFYSQGIVDDESCGEQLDHGVAVVGYGVDGNQSYWIVRNSWGNKWGDKGYVKILKQKGSSPGICGIAMAASYPTLSF